MNNACNVSLFLYRLNDTLKEMLRNKQGLTEEENYPKLPEKDKKFLLRLKNFADSR